jgi:6-pyruvoyltetrahydropterin/6-carboxytetrahydropterin synthase
MHKLLRSVRFSLNPFLESEQQGYNSYASRPAGEGLSIFFELTVGLVGQVETETGFIVNVADIDRAVHRDVLPVFAERIRADFRGGRHIGFCQLAGLLNSAKQLLADKFGRAKLNELSLKLNPFRKVAVDCGQVPEDRRMIYFSEKFEFAATHRLWNEKFSKNHNLEVFGKCANPAGHGHNYIVEVTVKTPISETDFSIGDYERVVDSELIGILDHKNLNADVAYFSEHNPTVENIAVFAWEKLAGKFGSAVLHCVTVWETDRTCCCYYGNRKD